MVKVEVAEFTDKVTGKVTEYHYVSEADYDALAAELASVKKDLDWSNEIGNKSLLRIRELEAALRDAQNRLLQVTEPWLGARADIIPAAVVAIVPLLNEWQSLLRSPSETGAKP